MPRWQWAASNQHFGKRFLTASIPSSGVSFGATLNVMPCSSAVSILAFPVGAPESVICDRFRLGELQDCVNGTPVVPRVSRWSEAAFDIRSLRKLAADGPFTVAEPSRPLLAASLSVALVENDDQGNVIGLARLYNDEEMAEAATRLSATDAEIVKARDAKVLRQAGMAQKQRGTRKRRDTGQGNDAASGDSPEQDDDDGQL